jgi:hypothetical protein
MRQFTLSIVATAVLAFAVPTVALGDDPGTGKIPPPHRILTFIDRTPMVELSDGGGGPPYLGSATSYNAATGSPRCGPSTTRASTTPSSGRSTRSPRSGSCAS